MLRFYQLTTTQSASYGVGVEHNTGDAFAAVSVYAGSQYTEARMGADALESVANALQIAARRLREAGNNG